MTTNFISYYHTPTKRRVYLNPSFIRRLDDDGICLYAFLTTPQGTEERHVIGSEDRPSALKQLGQGVGVELPNLKPSYSNAIPSDASPEYPVGTQVCVEGRNYQTINFKIERRFGTPWVNYTLAALDDSDDQIQMYEQDIQRYLVKVETEQQPQPKYQIGDRVWYQGDVWEITEPGKYADDLSYYLTDVNNPNRTCTAYEKHVHILNHFPKAKYKAGDRITYRGDDWRIGNSFTWNNAVHYVLVDVQDENRTITVTEREIIQTTTKTQLKYKLGDRVHYLAEDWVISYLWETIPGYTLQDPTNPDRTLKVTEREIIPSMVNRALDPVAAEVGRYDPDRDVEF